MSLQGGLSLTAEQEPPINDSSSNDEGEKENVHQNEMTDNNNETVDNNASTTTPITPPSGSTRCPATTPNTVLYGGWRRGRKLVK
jgi:hypothetical protein